MSFKHLLLVFTGLVLVACSNGSGSDRSGLHQDFKPDLKPSNGASPEDVRYYFSLLKASQFVLPEDVTLYDMVVASGKTELVNSKDREQSYSKLNQTGKLIHKSIKDTCKIDNAQGTVLGDETLKVGAKKVETAKMGIGGTSCVMTARMQEEVRTEIKALSFNEKNRSFSLTKDVMQTTFDGRRMDHADLRSASGLSLIEKSLLLRGTMTVKVQDEDMWLQGQMSGTGQMRWDLASGDSVSGPMTLEVVFPESGDMESQVLFEGQTQRGALRMVMIGKGKSQRVYVNGIEMDPSEVPMPQALKVIK